MGIPHAVCRHRDGKPKQMPFSVGVSIRVHVISAIFAAVSLAAIFSPPKCAAQDKPARSLIIPPIAEPQTLGPGDQIQVRALHAEELGDRPIRIDSEGYIMLPGLGRILAGGLTTTQLAADVKQLLSKTVRDPRVAIDIVELRSQPVSVLGSVRLPGVYQMSGQKRLLEVISQAGGLDLEAGDLAKITRGQATSAAGEAEKFQVLEVRLSDLMEGRRPEMNLVIHSGDVVTIPRAKLVYVIGQVRKPGGFVLRDPREMSVLKALSMAEGLMPNAALGNARILRQTEPHAQRKEIFVDVKAILAGKSADQELLPDDVLLVPTSTAKTVAMRLLETGIQMGTGLVIWRAY
jgi:polysaccharide biosynthesis/export protein